MERKWAEFLEDYKSEKKAFILGVIEEGYRYLGEEELGRVDSVYTPNYSSFLDNMGIIEPELEREAEYGWIKPWPHRPKVVSARGAVPKKDSEKLRLITDLS